MTNIFQNTENTEQTRSEVASDQAAPSTTPDIFSDKLNHITTEDGKPKYETVDKALDALVNAQSHIPKIEQENSELRNHLAQMMEKVEKVSKLEEVVERLNTAKETPAPQGTTEPAVDLSSQVNEILNERSKTEQLVSNELTVSNQMSAKFGDKVGDVLATKASELGVSMEYLQNTARTSPKMFMSLFGETIKQDPKVTTSSVNTAALPTTQAPRTSKSLMAGASSKDLMHEMASLKDEVKQKYGL